jgi:hypothetical protein
MRYGKISSKILGALLQKEPILSNSSKVSGRTDPYSKYIAMKGAKKI